MELLGTLEPLTTGLPAIESLDAPDLVLEDAEVLQIYYEIDSIALTAMLPPACQPTIPPTVSALVVRCADSVVGPVTMAQVRIGCRSGIWPRHYLLSTVVAEPSAATALERGWGFRCRPGTVELSVRNDRVEVAVSADRVALLRGGLLDQQPISAGDLWYAPNVHLAQTPHGVRLVHVDQQFSAVKRADRGQASITFLDAAGWGESRLRPSFAIAASHVVGTLQVAHLGMLNDPWLPGTQGLEEVR